MQGIQVAVIGPPGSGKSSFTSYLNFRELQRPRDHSTRFQFLVHDFGTTVPADIWPYIDFFVVTFDLTASYGAEPGLSRAWSLLCNNFPDREGFPRVCVVGTKLDLIPPTPLDIALCVEDRARKLAVRARTLRMFALSSVTGDGVLELTEYIANVVKPYKDYIPFTRSVRFLIDNMGTWLIDKLAEIFALPVPEGVNCPTTDPQDLDDPTIDVLIQSPETREWDVSIEKYATWPGTRSTTHKITPKLLVKRLSAVERATMLYVRSHTRIPVPEPRYPRLRKWLVMDFIDGTMLLECWESQSLWMKLRIACTLRGYIRQLRRLKGARPGSVVDGLIGSHTLFDEQDCGPFTSATQFRIWSECVAHGGWVRQIEHLRYHNISMEDPPYPVMGGDQWSLVFTHGDLNLSNIMLSKDGVLWIVDWATGGFFPPWLETVGIKYAEPPASFARLIPFISGSYPEYENFWAWFMSDVHRGYPMPPSA